MIDIIILVYESLFKVLYTLLEMWFLIDSLYRDLYGTD